MTSRNISASRKKLDYPRSFADCLTAQKTIRFFIIMVLVALSYSAVGQVKIHEKVQIAPRGESKSAPISPQRPFNISTLQGHDSCGCGPTIVGDSSYGHIYLGGRIKFTFGSQCFDCGDPQVKFWLTDKNGLPKRPLNLNIFSSTDSIISYVDSIDVAMWEEYGIMIENQWGEWEKASVVNFGLPPYKIGEYSGQVLFGPIIRYYTDEYGNPRQYLTYADDILTQYTLIDSGHVGPVPVYSGPPYSGGIITIPYGSMYRLILNSGKIQKPDSLYITMPYESLLMSDIQNHYGDTLMLGPFEKQEQLQLALKPGWGYFAGRKLYACIQPDGKYPVWSVRCEDWEDFDFSDLIGRLEYAGDPILVKTKPRRIAPGDSTSIVIKYVSVEGDTLDFSPDDLFRVEIIDSVSHGRIINAYGEASTEMISYGPFHYVSDTVQVKDTVEVQIRVTKIEQGMAGSIKDGSKRPVRSKVPEPMLSVRGGGSRDRTRDFNNGDATGVGSAEILQPNILLGETKYYYARTDPDDASNLIIDERTTPDFGTESGIIKNKTVWGDSSVIQVSGGKLGVHFDKKLPVVVTSSNGGDSIVSMKDIPEGLIRLVGRYWDRDSTYKIMLKATYENLEGNIEIIVRRPDSLGDQHTTVSGPTQRDGIDSTYNLDSLIIEYAGREGVMPQIIKAICNHESIGFQPTYRWEPFADMTEVQTGTTKFDSTYIYWIRNSTNLGNPGIPIHNNLHDALGSISGYPGYQTVWDYYQIKRGMYTKYIYASVGKRWLDYYTGYKKSLPKDGNGDPIDKNWERTAPDTADAQLSRWCRNEIGGIGMDGTVAQTRIAASYGLMQLTYYNGIKAFEKWGYNYPNNSSDYLPEYITIPPIGLKYGILHFKGKLRIALRATKFITPTWPDGLEYGYRLGLQGYNGDSKYPAQIMRTARTMYQPRKRK